MIKTCAKCGSLVPAKRRDRYCRSCRRTYMRAYARTSQYKTYQAAYQRNYNQSQTTIKLEEAKFYKERNKNDKQPNTNPNSLDIPTTRERSSSPDVSDN